MAYWASHIILDLTISIYLILISIVSLFHCVSNIAALGLCVLLIGSIVSIASLSEQKFDARKA
jgi:hypothetical protein